MSVRRLQAAFGVGVFTVMVAVFSLLPTHWHGTSNYEIKGVPVTQPVTFTCGSAWGSASTKGPASIPGPVTGHPCGYRTTLQVMGVLDLGFGLGAMAFVIWWRPRDRREEAALAV